MSIVKANWILTTDTPKSKTTMKLDLILKAVSKSRTTWGVLSRISSHHTQDYLSLRPCQQILRRSWIFWKVKCEKPYFLSTCTNRACSTEKPKSMLWPLQSTSTWVTASKTRPTKQTKALNCKKKNPFPHHPQFLSQIWTSHTVTNGPSHLALITPSSTQWLLGDLRPITIMLTPMIIA